MSRLVIVALRVLIVVLLLGLLVGQTVLAPVYSGEMAQVYPEVAYLRWPMLVAVVAMLLCAEVALVSVWRLLSMVRRDDVFSPAAFRHVDTITVAVAVATVLAAIMNAYLSLVVHGNPPAVVLTLAALTFGGAALALLMGVMKALLRQATRLRADLAEVV